MNMYLNIPELLCFAFLELAVVISAVVTLNPSLLLVAGIGLVAFGKLAGMQRAN